MFFEVSVRTLSDILSGERGGALHLRDLQPGDIGWIVHRQSVLYAHEHGWTNGYEALATQILADFVRRFDPRLEAAWIAELDGEIVGSVFLVRSETPQTGKLRLLYVEPHARSLGIGRQLVEACIERARACGYQTLVLWTNSVLTAARRLYERAGFVLIEETAHHSFGHDLIGQTWSMDLRPSARIDTPDALPAGNLR